MVNYNSWDYFFYYGNMPIEEEIEVDLWNGLLQPLRTFAFNRNDSVGIETFENNPNSLSIVKNSFYIVNWIALHNEAVSKGESIYPDRRIATSQELINFFQNKSNLDIEVNYIPFFSLQFQKLLTSIKG